MTSRTAEIIARTVRDTDRDLRQARRDLTLLELRDRESTPDIVELRARVAQLTETAAYLRAAINA